MKKIISVILTVVLISCFGIGTMALDKTDTAIILSPSSKQVQNFSEPIRNIVLSKMLSGKTVYYGKGTQNPAYLAEKTAQRSANDNSVINLPSGAAVFDFDMMTSGSTYYSPHTFYASSSCKMQIYRNGSANGSSFTMNLKVVDSTTNLYVFNDTISVTANGGFLDINLTAGHTYYFSVTPTVSNAYVSFVISGK